MRFPPPALTLTALLAMTTPADDKKDNRVYEMRVYYAAPGKLDALNARFRDHTMRLFEKHGMTNVGYFLLLGDHQDANLVHFYVYPSDNARAEKRQAYRSEQDRDRARARSETDGKPVG